MRPRWTQPYCGPHAPFESREWFDDGDRAASFAFLPLRTHAHVRLARARQPTIPQRFHAGMGTLYLTRLSELASVATARFLPQP